MVGHREQIRELRDRRFAAEQAIDECADGHGPPRGRRGLVEGVARLDKAADHAAAEREADIIHPEF